MPALINERFFTLSLWHSKSQISIQISSDKILSRVKQFVIIRFQNLEVGER